MADFSRGRRERMARSADSSRAGSTAPSMDMMPWMTMGSSLLCRARRARSMQLSRVPASTTATLEGYRDGRPAVKADAGRAPLTNRPARSTFVL